MFGASQTAGQFNVGRRDKQVRLVRAASRHPQFVDYEPLSEVQDWIEANSMNMEDFVRTALPHPDECRRKAQELRDARPGASVDELIERAIKTAKQWAAAYGVGSGVATNPLAMVPAAAADMGLTMRAEAHLVGVIAALKVPSSCENTEEFHTDILAVMFPNAVSQALREVGVQAGKTTTRTLIRKYISGNLLKAIITFAAKYLGIKLTQRAIISKAVPLVGAAIGATWNWVEVERCGRRALKYFSDG